MNTTFSYKKDLIQNTQRLFVEHLNLLEVNLGKNVRPFLERIKTFDSLNHINPSLFSSYWALRRAMQAGTLDKIDESLDFISHSLIISDSSEKKVSAISTDHWEINFVKEQQKFTTHEYKPTDIRMEPIDLNICEKQRHYIEQAICMIKSVSDYDYDNYQQLVSNIKLFDGKMRGLTSIEVFGALYLRIPHAEDDPVLYYVEHIVHETSHLLLHAIMNQDKVVLNSEEEKFKAPIRKDLRPMYGIFHAGFVLSRMHHVFQRLNETKFDRHFFDMKHRIHNWAYSAIDTIKENAKLTQLGQVILLEMERSVQLL